MSTLVSVRGSLEGAWVLDAFAGSGALGIEALSRGAERAVFCEKDRLALSALQRNLDIVGVASNTSPAAFIKRGDCLGRPPVESAYPYDLVFLDPPYALPDQSVFSMLSMLQASGSLKKEVVVAYEHSADRPLSDSVTVDGVTWHRIREKRYGDTALDVFRKD